MFAELTSANTVGYGRQDMLKGKYNLVGFSFDSIAGDGITLNSEGFTGTDLCGKTSNLGADKIEIYNPFTEGYESFFYRSTTSKWVEWASRTTPYETNHDPLLAGSLVWFLSNGDTAPALTISGAVLPTDDSNQEIVIGKYNLFCNPFPVAWTLNDLTKVDWTTAVGKTSNLGADKIEIYDPETEGYESFFYRSTTSKWVEWASRTTPYETNHDPLAAAQGFWYLSAEQDSEDKTTYEGEDFPVFDIIFKSPLAKADAE